VLFSGIFRGPIGLLSKERGYGVDRAIKVQTNNIVNFIFDSQGNLKMICSGESGTANDVQNSAVCD
jgi:hypothetical protein